MLVSEEEAESRLAELRRQRDSLDRAIADLALYLELGRRLKASPTRAEDVDRPAEQPASSGARHRRPRLRSESSDSVSPLASARRYGRELIDATLVVLEKAGRPLHARDLLDLLSARGFSLPGKDPVAALNTRLWKRSGPDGPLRRVGKAMYAAPVRGAGA